jgi:hypothetical protein
MRRKRAELKGKQTDLTMHKLKTGPRNCTKEEASLEASSSTNTGGIPIESEVKNTRSISEDVSDQILPIDSDEDEDDNPSSLNPVSRRRRLKARSDLSPKNISLDSIIAMNLDVFNYSKMGKLLKYVASLFFMLGTLKSSLTDSSSLVMARTWWTKMRP